jgi:radical SAM superfamily enzyme YgiQ (UPF0313 family)
MRYEGPIYRPPSEADSLLIQATVGCPHNKCTFCMVYKKGPPYKVRPVREIKADVDAAAEVYGNRVQTVFLPAGNTIAMPTDQLTDVCRHIRNVFPKCRRITVYGSSQYLYEKGLDNLTLLAEAGLTRIHVGMESGDDKVLAQTKKGADSATQIQGCQMAIRAGLEISVYVVLGLGGTDRTVEHAQNTANAINQIRPHFVRLRTFIPKINTLMLHQIKNGKFRMLGPHGVLREIETILESLEAPTEIRSDHYTNYVDISGKMPQDRNAMLDKVRAALKKPESDFRPVFVGTQ